MRMGYNNVMENPFSELKKCWHTETYESTDGNRIIRVFCITCGATMSQFEYASIRRERIFLFVGLLTLLVSILSMFLALISLLATMVFAIIQTL